MIILCTAFRSLEEYLSTGGAAKPELPAKCPRCGLRDVFQRHGGYWRQVLEGQQTAEIKIPRGRCKRCRLVVSLLYAFLLPHRRFTTRAVAAGIEGYIQEPGTYRLWAYETSGLPPELSPEQSANPDEMVRPHYSQIFRWTKALVSVSDGLLQQVQKELVLSDKPVPNASESPNASRATTHEKRVKLNLLSTVLAFGRNLLARALEIARGLHAYFLSSAESPFAFLIGTARQNWIPQSL
jgi:hypothetical protein